MCRRGATFRSKVCQKCGVTCGVHVTAERGKRVLRRRTDHSVPSAKQRWAGAMAMPPLLSITFKS